MESRTNSAKEELERQAEIRRQIAVLQAQLKDTPVTPITPHKQIQHAKEAKVIAAGTPSPKKRKLDAKPLAQRPRPSMNVPPQSKPNLNPTKDAERPVPEPSKLLSNLTSLHARSSKVSTEPVARSKGFTDKAPPSGTIAPMSPQARDDRLALVEKLMPGPQDHKAPIDDPHFERLEPNSGIHLNSRKLAHADLQQYLRGRYYLPPSLMYSVIRPLPSNQGYDVPVPGDWLTIAVIAERGPIKLTSTSSSSHLDDEPTAKPGKGKGKQNSDAKDDKAGGRKKYMSLKLVDFGTRTVSGAKPQIRGDALLTLLLFEADSYSNIEDESRPKGSKAEKFKVYKGGSGGAFEACMKLHEGAVIAIMNPRILKPYQRNMNTPHPTNNILAITPTSAESIAIIGRSRDLGTCAAVKRDGKPCGSWCDKRVAESCEYHVENAVRRNRASRPEFSIGTSGMSTTARANKPAFDPKRKWGLLPATGGGAKGSSTVEGGSTYVISGHVISAAGPEYVGEKIGRGREERAKRRRDEKATEEALNNLLGRDGGGGDRNEAAGAVRKAREVMKRLKGEKLTKLPPNECSNDRRKPSYSAETIQRLGFDPTTKSGHHSKAEEPTIKRKLEALESLQKNRGDIELGPRPGKRIRSGVSVPTAASFTPGTMDSVNEFHKRAENSLEKATSKPIPDESDDDLEVESPP